MEIFMRSFEVRRLYTASKIWSVDYTEEAAEIIHSLFSKQVKLLNDKRALYNILFLVFSSHLLRTKKIEQWIYLDFFIFW